MERFLQDPSIVLLVSLIFVICSIVFLRIGAFLSLLFGAALVSFWTAFFIEGSQDWGNAVTRVCAALGTTTGGIGVLIVFGTIVGKCMTDSGAADCIIVACLRLFGKKRADVALAGGAFLLSIPVFYDATFYLLLPLVKSVYRNVKKNYVLYLLSVGLPAMVSHTMIPPTPGPVAVAQTLGVPLSASIGIGLLVAVFLIPSVMVLAHILNKCLPNPKIDPVVLEELNMGQKEELTQAHNSNDQMDDKTSLLPPLWLSLFPIVLPAIMIIVASVVKTVLGSPEELSNGTRFLFLLGDSNVALGISALCAAAPLLFFKRRRVTRFQLEEKLNSAISSAGTIILITAAGGAYGAMLKCSGIGDRIQELFNSTGDLSGSMALILAFAASSLLKLAQGSGTTAMITSASIFVSMEFTSQSLGFNLGYLAAVIGAGACAASWMNDSAFCLFSRSSGVSELDSLKVWTVGTGMIGVLGLGIILILSRVLPFV